MSITTYGCAAGSASSSRNTPVCCPGSPRLDAIGAEFVTVDVAVAWATESLVPDGSVVPAMRLLVVRGFARYLAGLDSRTEIETALSPPTS